MSTMDKLSAIPRTGCSCGKPHPMITKEARVVDDAPNALRTVLLSDKPNGRILIICDETTYEVLGKRVEESLKDITTVDTLILNPSHLHADEGAIGAAMMEIRHDTARVVAVGSGTINDISRYAACRAGLPYDVIGTSPSMDGYTSPVSPLLRRGFKLTFTAIPPTYALLDLPTMRKSPQEMIAAGLGDMLGKYTALCDWELSHLVMGENKCPEIAGLMREAVDTCVAQANELPGRGAQAIENLAEGLLMSGVAMQMANDSRPASGAEHMLAHFWEMRQLMRDGDTALHGDKVGLGTLLVLDYYKKFFDVMLPEETPDRSDWEERVHKCFGPLAGGLLTEDASDPLPHKTICENARRHWDALKKEADSITLRRKEMEGYLRACGGPVRPEELNLRKEDIRDALLFAKETRTRFTIMRLAFAWGVHEKIVEAIVEELYG